MVMASDASRHQAAFLQAICADPEDDSPRLVYADWLDDHGDADRAAFIRVQCELARLPADDERRSELQARERRLLVRNYWEWTAACRDWPAHLRQVRFRRGFVERLGGWQPQGLLEQAPAIFGTHPVRDLGILSQDEGWGHALGDCTFLRRLRTLRLRARPADLLGVCRSVYLFDLEVLDLTNNISGEEALIELLGDGGRVLPPALRSLRGLVLHHNLLSDAAIFTLCESPLAHTLDRLDLSTNWAVTPDGLRTLLDSPLWPRLVELNLGDIARGSEETGRLLAAGLARARLVRLGLSGGPRDGARGAALAEALAGASSWGPLRALSLYLCQVGSGGWGALAGCPHLAGLRWLDLRQCGLTTQGAEVLAACPHLAGLTVLKLGGNRIGDEGVEALAASPHLRRLTYLDLHGTGVTAAGVAALAASPNSERLRVLNLHYSGVGRGIGDAGLIALAGSPRFGRLTTLYLNAAYGITDAGVRALVASPYLRCLTYLDLYALDLTAEGQKALLKADAIAWPGLDQFHLRTRSLTRLHRQRFGPFRGLDSDWDDPFFSWEG
jgi:uncharacterized protein (TIGR02996 family)